jgi:hypothetical protein
VNSVYTGRAGFTSYSEVVADRSEERISQLGQVRVRLKSAYLYSEPWLESDKIGKITPHTELKRIKETDYWLYVESPIGVKGWIAKDWLNKENLPPMLQHEIVERCTCWYRRGDIEPTSCHDTRCEPAQRVQ